MNIIQVIPFDLGFTTHPLIEDDKQSLKKFINTLSLKVKSTNWEYNQPTSDHCVALYYFDKNLSCYIMEFGVGVFVLNIKGCIDNTYLESLPMNYNDIAFNLYYAKKKTQNLILKGTRSKEDEKHIRYMNQFMENAWSITKQKNRQFSSTSNYKYKGFSYILSIYHIHVKKFSKELLEKNSNLYKSLYLLMEPSIMKNILEINKQNKIKDNIQNIEPKKFEYNILSETSIVAHSWSGIAVVEEYNNYHSLEEIIELEVRIQATWFLYDCIIDNINNTKYSIVDLQKIKNTIDYISMDTDNIISANMSTGDKDIINSIVKSSGLYSIKEKAFMIINNKIAIENAYVQERSHKYTLFTEIILLLLTLISAYDPIKSVVNSNFKNSDLVIGIILITIFIVLSIFMIRKE